MIDGVADGEEDGKEWTEGRGRSERGKRGGSEEEKRREVRGGIEGVRSRRRKGKEGVREEEEEGGSEEEERKGVEENGNIL
ncbi:hypothetical protein Pmani_016880 [Petrolisthes manimaculis]|uniref:Uncharacterized protein n=1 Tax=Petrolisthes manimaculis TaxID=1843537 RepID=A0AAE1PNH7_9EUCA|nr:hypothetical protein Pmani_016880 [Petrolisthes manimaculis]